MSDNKDNRIEKLTQDIEYLTELFANLSERVEYLEGYNLGREIAEQHFPEVKRGNKVDKDEVYKRVRKFFRNAGKAQDQILDEEIKGKIKEAFRQSNQHGDHQTTFDGDNYHIFDKPKPELEITEDTIEESSGDWEWISEALENATISEKDNESE